MLKKLYLHIFDKVHTAFSYKRELIVYSCLQDFSKGKGSSLQLIYNAHIAFLLCGADIFSLVINVNYCRAYIKLYACKTFNKIIDNEKLCLNYSTTQYK